MSNRGTPGPEVDPTDDLYRCLTTQAWWVAEAKRPSSAAFRQPDFSVDVASLAGSPAYTLQRFPKGCGLVRFHYADAKAIGFAARIESDRHFPENRAHANVYNTHGSNKRKAMAQKLVQRIMETGGVLVEPSFTV